MDKKLKKLPVGVYTLEKIINENYLYIDKTQIALNLIENNEYVFLSRPRRFGKSLFLDTLSEIFKGNKELFKGLYIYDKYDFKEYPVIKISFSGGVYNKEDLNEHLLHVMKINQENLGIECENQTNASICFSELIIQANKKYKSKVVVLIDEYDKPILDNITNPESAGEIRNSLRDFYTRIKDSDRYLKFAFLTGVSKFTKTSIFSGLNNITDITLNPRYGNICGYTQKDIETLFLPYLNGVDLKKLKEWYNGYNFLKDKVYNPYNILLFIQKGKKYKNYWFESGTPTFLIKLIKEQNYVLPRLSDITVGEELINSFDVDNIRIETLLFQTGYLTIDKENETLRGGYVYDLKMPNIEVRISLNDLFINYLTNNFEERIKIQDKLYLILQNAELNEFKTILISLFASLPYNNYVGNNISYYEGYYASVIYAYLASLGIDIIAEDVTNRGRIDLTVKMGNYIYIIEFKVTSAQLSNSSDDTEKGENTALQQIKDKNYAQKYLSEGKDIYLIGIVFDKEEKNITHFNWETIKSI